MAGRSARAKTHGQTAHQVALHQQDEDEGRNNAGGAQRRGEAPALGGQQAQLHRQHPDGRGEEQRHDEFRPRENGAQHETGGDAAVDQRHMNAQEALQAAGAVDRGGLGHLARDIVQERFQQQDGEGQIGGGMRQDDAGAGVAQTHLVEDQHQRHQHRDGRQHALHDDPQHDVAAALPPGARQPIGGRQRQGEREAGSAQRDDDRIGDGPAGGEQRGVRRERHPVIIERGLKAEPHDGIPVIDGADRLDRGKPPPEQGKQEQADGGKGHGVSQQAAGGGRRHLLQVWARPGGAARPPAGNLTEPGPSPMSPASRAGQRALPGIACLCPFRRAVGRETGAEEGGFSSDVTRRP